MQEKGKFRMICSFSPPAFCKAQCFVIDVLERFSLQSQDLIPHIVCKAIVKLQLFPVTETQHCCRCYKKMGAIHLKEERAIMPEFTEWEYKGTLSCFSGWQGETFAGTI